MQGDEPERLTEQGYWARVRELGLVFVQDAGDRHALCRTREGEVQQVRKPDDLNPEERAGVLRDVSAS